MTVRHIIGFFFTIVVASLLVVGQTQKQELNDQFWEAVRKGDAPAVTALLDKGADVNAKFRYGTTALFKAAERGHIEVVKILLARGADVTVKDTFYGATAMTWALDNNHLDVVQALLEKQPSNIEDVLFSGVTDGKPDLIKLALARGGLKKETLTVALYLASQDKDSTEAAELLKKGGAVPPPVIDATKLQSYAGEYKNGAQNLAVRFNQGSLSGALPDQRPRPFMPHDETNFEVLFIDGDVMVTFKVDQGKVVGLTLKQGEKKTEFTRVN